MFKTKDQAELWASEQMIKYGIRYSNELEDVNYSIDINAISKKMEIEDDK